MLQVALSQLRTNSRRFIAIALAVIISVLFLSATLIADASLKQMLRSSFGQSYEKADLVVSPDPEKYGSEAKGASLTEADIEAMERLPGVSQVYPLYYLDTFLKTSDDKNIVSQILALPPEDLNAYIVNEGELPANDEQIAVSTFFQERYDIGKGDVVTMVDSATPEKVHELTVSGIVEGNNNPDLMGRPIVFGVGEFARSFAVGQPKNIQKIELKLSTDMDKKSIHEAAERHFENRSILVNTADQQVKSDLKYTASGTEFMTSALTLFAGIAFFVSILVISNTFTVLVAGRMRELALLRCVGANRTQIRNSVILESLIVGFFSSVVGVIGAIGLVAAAITYVKTLPSFSFASLTVPPQAIITGLLSGTLITVIAAFYPALRATRITPLAALHPQEDMSLSSAKGKGVLATGAVLALLGGLIMVLGATADFDVFGRASLAALGGIGSFVGVLMCSRLFVPQAVKLVGSLSAPLGTPGELARVNAVRNPVRTSATATALLVGVTLVTVMLTGAQGARQSVDEFFKSIYPMDTVVSGLTASQRIFTEDLAQKVESSVDEVKAAEVAAVGGKYTADNCTVTFGGIVATIPRDQLETPECYAVTMSQETARRVLYDQSIAFKDNEILVPKDFGDQETLNISGETGSKTLRVVKGNTNNLLPLITPETAKEVGGIAPKIGERARLGDMEVSGVESDFVNQTLPHIWIAYKDGLTDQEKLAADEEIARIVGVDAGQITGVSLFKSIFKMIIDVILGIVSALLIISVFIALIGMGNTLSLSVLERTRENALLRALGLTNNQLRGMLTIESILIAVVSALLGIILGTIFGNFGIKAIFGGFAGLIIPWGPIITVLAIAVIAGLVASLLPARRATRLSPVEGLAVD